MTCAYCGNTSGKTDIRGNCIGCGATLPLSKLVDWFSSFNNDYLDTEWRLKYLRGTLTPQEIRDMENE